MKFSKAPLFLLSAAAPGMASVKAAYQPVRIDYQTLANNSDEDVKAIQSMMETLHNVGMVSVTNFPSSFRRNKQTVQAYAESCSQESQAAKTHVFQDGTKRTTSKCIVVLRASFTCSYVQ